MPLFGGEIKSTPFYSVPFDLSAKCSVKGDCQGPRAGEGPADPWPPPRPAPSLSPQQGRLGWAKDSDGGQSQPSHCKAPPQTPGLARQAAPRARTGSGPEMVTSIIQTRVESHGSQPVDQGPGLGWWSTEPSHRRGSRVPVAAAWAGSRSGRRSRSSAAALGEEGEAPCFWLFISRPPAALLLSWPSAQEAKPTVLRDIQGLVSAVGS